MFFDWRHRSSGDVNLVKGRYPSMADSNERCSTKLSSAVVSEDKTKHADPALAPHVLFWLLAVSLLNTLKTTKLQYLLAFSELFAR
jgi:hypothetical protein